MRSPEPFHLPPTSDDRPPATEDPARRVDGAVLLHRHLRLRLEAAREELRTLETTAPVSPHEGLATAVGARVTDVQRTVAAARAAFETRAATLRQVAGERAARIVADAEAEAQVLRAAAAWLRPTAADEVRGTRRDEIPVGASR